LERILFKGDIMSLFYFFNDDKGEEKFLLFVEKQRENLKVVKREKCFEVIPLKGDDYFFAEIIGYLNAFLTYNAVSYLYNPQNVFDNGFAKVEYVYVMTLYTFEKGQGMTIQDTKIIKDKEYFYEIEQQPVHPSTVLGNIEKKTKFHEEN
jgi:hypothetical protein